MLRLSPLGSLSAVKQAKIRGPAQLIIVIVIVIARWIQPPILGLI